MAILVAFGHLQTAGKLHGNLRWCRWVFLFLVFVFLLSCLPFCLSALLALFACLLSPRSALLASFSFFSLLSVFPPCFFLFVLSVSFFLPSLSFRFSLPSLFSSNRLLSQQQGQKNKQKKIIDNPGWVWLTGSTWLHSKWGWTWLFPSLKDWSWSKGWIVLIIFDWPLMWRLVVLLLWVGTQYIYSIYCPGGTQKLKNGQRTCNTITTATTKFVAVVVVVVVMLHISTLHSALWLEGVNFKSAGGERDFQIPRDPSAFGLVRLLT